MAHPLQVSVLPDCSDNLDRIEEMFRGVKMSENFTEKYHHLDPMTKKSMFSPLLVTKNRDSQMLILFSQLAVFRHAPIGKYIIPSMGLPVPELTLDKTFAAVEKKYLTKLCP